MIHPHGGLVMIGSRRCAALSTALALGLSGPGLAGSAVGSSAAPPPEAVASATTAAGTTSGTATGARLKPVNEVMTARAAKKSKGLKVVVKRPAAAKSVVKVTVTGPRKKNGKKFRAVIRRTKTWSTARPGVYRVKAKTITLHDQRVKPTVSLKKVRITKKRTRRTSRVTYRTPRFCQSSGTRLVAWGDNQSGQLGRTGPTLSIAGVTNPWLRGATAVTGAAASTYALCADGSVWSWGLNTANQLGIGRTGNRHWPVRVPGLTGVRSVAAATDSAYALRADGSVWAWGSGRYGQLGDGRSGFGTTASRPVKVLLPGRATQIAAGGHSAYAVLDDGRVVAWGNGGVGQRGNGTAGESTPTPVVVLGLGDVVEIAAGQVTAYARTSGGAMVGWGGSNQGEIPNVAPSTSTPFTIATGITKIGASRSAGYFVTSTLHGFGSGRHHDTGRNTGGSPTTPDQVPGPFFSPKQMAGAGYASYLLDPDGRVYAWGDNNLGQVGAGALTGPSHTQGIAPTLVRGIAAGPALGIGAGQRNGYLIH